MDEHTGIPPMRPVRADDVPAERPATATVGRAALAIGSAAFGVVLASLTETLPFWLHWSIIVGTLLVVLVVFTLLRRAFRRHRRQS